MTATAIGRAGVIGINRRNADYVARFNERRLYPLVDDKLITKKLAQDNGIPVPELFGALETPRDIPGLKDLVAERQSFVVKPSHGSGGDGIVVIDSHRGERFWSCSGNVLLWAELAHHLENTLGGQYSLGGHPDRVMVEYRVRFDPMFNTVSYLGVPDIRIIVFMGYPVMAMLRLPTRRSGGKANLHQGAVGAGIDVANGKTVRGVVGNQSIVEHPDTGTPITGLDVPYWQQMLLIAARCYEMTGLGYLGVDLVLDEHLGPLMLELNARPGLNIQIANGAGLLPRLKHVERDADPTLSPEERVGRIQDLVRSGGGGWGPGHAARSDD
jgi:alpha-L-glutamate ligase-like protein